MSRTTKRSNFRVVIEPRGLGQLGSFSVSDRFFVTDEAHRQRQYESMCESIKEDVRRHVDDVGHVYIDSDSEDVCGYCGQPWTEDNNDYNGGCCKQDEDAHVAREAE